MKRPFKRILYGGDYNPNQWGKEVWKEDMRIFKDARINSATINVFSWAKIQPSEEIYNFTELDEIIDMLSRENYDIVLATSTGALPAWMVKRYPEVARTDYEGRHHKFGQRHNACPNSPVFQKFASRLAGKLAERYGDNPHVTCWHISNEYGGECYCENCEKAFRVWLRGKYQTLDELNKAWNTEFWGHTIYDWDEVVLPDALGDGIEDAAEPHMTAFAGLSIDYCRFNSDGMLNNFKMEKEAIRKFDKETPITTNMMGTFKGLDYFKWAKEIDVISWDNYPSYNTPWSMVAMKHDLMRGLKDKPFMLMEQTPSQQNWQPYNSLKRPGQMRAQSYQTMAHGADTIQFFQLRRSVGGCEKFHGAVIAHAGTENTRVFREVKQLGEELERLSDLIPGSVNEAEVGVIFDWDNYWALEYTSGPSISLKYVKNGGILVTTYMSGIVGESDNVYLGGYPGPLKEMAGVWVEEIDALAPEQHNIVTFKDGSRSKCKIVCDLMHLEGAESLGEYTEDFYAGMPAVTRHSYGKGKLYYIGTCMEEDGIAKILSMAVEDAGAEPVAGAGNGLEIVKRNREGKSFYFVMNFRDEELEIPEEFAGKTDLLSGNAVGKGEKLPKFGVKIVVE